MSDYSPTLQIDPDRRYTLQECLDMFLIYEMPTRGYKERTKVTYACDLKDFASILKQTTTYIDQLALDKIKSYNGNLESRDLDNATRQKKLAGVRTFIKFLEWIDEEYHPHHWFKPFSSQIKKPAIEEKQPRPLTEEQYKALLAEARTSKRDSAILEVLLQTGMRVSEITKLVFDDLSIPEKPSPKSEAGLGTVQVRGKRGRIDTITLTYKACVAVLEYKKDRERRVKEYLKKHPEEQGAIIVLTHVFLTNKGRPAALKKRQVQTLFKKYAIRAGVSWAHPHTMRTTNITMHVARGTNILEVKNMARHERLDTTQKYVRYVRRAMEIQKNEL